jgi:hypothetical protein
VLVVVLGAAILMRFIIILAVRNFNTDLLMMVVVRYNSQNQQNNVGD